MDDWFQEAITEVDRAGRRLVVAVQALPPCLAEAARQREQGLPLPEIVGNLMLGGGREARLRANEAMLDYARAVQRLRSGMVLRLVDEEGMALTDVAALMHVSRQVTSRMYASAVDHSP
jgi:DNA-directed RNA polymerase specialized sigma24 family protein